MKIYATDTETGGFEPDTAALISWTLVELDPLTLLPVPERTLDLFILPCADRAVSPGAAQINGYTPERWAARSAVPLVEAYQRALVWLGADPAQLIAHNAKFDRTFVTHYEVKAGIKLPLVKDWLCTLALSRDICYRRRISVPNHKLDTMARHCGHWAKDYVRGDHGSLDDSLACAAVYRWAKGQTAPAAPTSKTTFEQAARFVMPLGKHKGLTVGQIATDDRGLSYIDWLRGETTDPALKEILDTYCNEPGIAADLKGMVRP